MLSAHSYPIQKMERPSKILMSNEPPVDVPSRRLSGANTSHDGIRESGPAVRSGNSITTFWHSVFAHDAAAEIVVTRDDYHYMGPLAPILAWLDNYFRVSDRKSSFYLEIIGGITTFFSMCYILVLNGIIIAGPFNTGISVNGVFFATALASGIFTSLMGWLVNVPVALAPGMGLNGYFATVAPACYPTNPTGDFHGTPCPGWGETSLPWTDAMGAVFISGWLYVFFTVTGLRSILFTAIPKSLRAAIIVGIGFFITIIGLKIGSLTRVTVASWAMAYHVYDEGGCSYSTSSGVSCSDSVDLDFTWFELGFVKFNTNPSSRIAVLGLVVVSALECLKVKGAIIISIVLATVIGINYVNCDSGESGNACVTDLSVWTQKGGPDFIVDVSDIPSGKMTFHYINKPFFWDCVFTFLFVELFDSFGTLTGIMTRAGLMKGDPEKAMTRVNRAMCVDGCGLWLGAIIGSNSITSFVESNTGIEAGARTGFASVITGMLFLLSLLFVKPFVQIIPDPATTCALVLVGVHSLSGVQEINFKDFADACAAFFTIFTMGFTYSIANGICSGFIIFTWLRTIRYIQKKIAKYFKKEEYMPSSDVDSSLPHPLMFAMSVYAIVRWSVLSG